MTQKNNISNAQYGRRQRAVYLIDAVILIASIGTLAFFISFNNPMIIAPLNDTVTTNSSVLFTFQKAEVIYIDTNPNFTSPEKIYAKDNMVIHFEPGIYYFKVEGVKQSDVQKITIKSVIGLRLKESDGAYELVNAGNTKLNVDVYNNSILTGRIILDTDTATNVTGNMFIGGAYATE